jgi:hypothetical protein
VPVRFAAFHLRLFALAVACVPLGALVAPPAWALTAPDESADRPVVAARPLPRLLGSDTAPPVGTPAIAGGDESAAASARATVARRRARAAEALAGWAPDGRTEARWNAWTGLPHRVWGADLGLDGPRVAGRLDRAAAAEAAARAFLAARPDLWAGEDRPTAAELVLAKAHRVGATWFLVFSQRHRGLDVEGGRVDLRLRDDGTVALLGADWFPAVSVPVAARLPLGVADARARAELGFAPARDQALGGTTVIVPLPGPDGAIDYRVAHRVRHRLDDPPARWVSWIDATTGETLARENELRYATQAGTIRGAIHPARPTDPLELRPFRDEIVAFTQDSTASDASGVYALPGVNPGFLIRTGLRGPFLSVVHFALPEAAQTLTAPASGPLDFTWTPANSDTAERDAFYHGHVAHDRVKAIEPAFTALDYRMPCNVNIGNQCNAFWDGLGMNFYRWGVRPSDGRACANTGTIADVIYHEYGHGRTEHVFAPFAPSGAMHEGLSDYFAATTSGQPDIGRGFFGPGTILRTAANTQRVDFAGCLGEAHCVGNAISGALWDLRGRLVAGAATPAEGERLADSLFHYAGYGGAAWHDDYLLDLLVVDDDDGNLLSGTPHAADICAAFTPRGIACPAMSAGVWFVHTPLPDADPGTGFFTVNAQIGSAAGAFDPASPVLTWRLNGGPDHDVPMNLLAGSNYRAAIPPVPAGGTVEYSLRARDFGAGLATAPAGAPAERYTFHVGARTTVWADDFETPRGWTAALEGATSGRWVRVDPNGTSTGGSPPFFFSPEDDHTPGGTFCFVTGDTTAGMAAGFEDVDGGCVTLTSPRLDLGALDNARLDYWRWFVDATRYDDTLSVAVSADDGASWVELERVYRTEEGWVGRSLDLGAVIPLTAQVRLRLRTCDGGGGSLLEAGLDDVRITTRLFGAVAVGDDPAGEGIPAAAFLGPVAPNPARRGEAAAIAFGVPAGAGETPVRLEVVDARGRVVRTLVAGNLPPGRHLRRWGGEDDRGARAGAGVYFVHLAMPGLSRHEKVVRLE